MFRSLINRIQKYHQQRKEYRQLNNLSDQMLKDIGIHRGEIEYRFYKEEDRRYAAGNYTKPTMRKSLVASVKAGGKGGKPGQWSARKAQMVAKKYKAKGGGYTS